MSKIINPLTIFLAMVGAVFIAFFYDEGMIGDKGGDERRVAASYTNGQTNTQRLNSYKAKPKPNLFRKSVYREYFCGTTDLGDGQTIGYILSHFAEYTVLPTTGKKWPQGDSYVTAAAYLNVNKLTGKKLVGVAATADYKLEGSTLSLFNATGVIELLPKDGFIIEKTSDSTVTLQNSDGSLKVELDRSTTTYPDTPKCTAAYELDNRVNGRKLRGEH